MQLLKITSIPIQYTMEIEAPRLEAAQEITPPKVSVEIKPSQLRMRSELVKVRLDTTEARRSLHHKNNTDFAADEATKGKIAAKRATEEYVQFGARMMQPKGPTIGEIVRQQIRQQPQVATVFLPSTGPDISWDKPSLSTQYEPSEVSLDWKIRQSQMSFVPGSFKMNISQYPRVQIEYTGDPIYFPDSANPNKSSE